MPRSRLPKDAIRARMAQTGETYQQAANALRRQIPPTWLQPPNTKNECVGHCASIYRANDAAGVDGGSMTDCARCPGSVCLECGRRPVADPYERCPECADAVEAYERDRMLQARCAGRRCISIDHALRELGDRSDRGMWASNRCYSCDEPVCFFCGRAPAPEGEFAFVCPSCEGMNYNYVVDERRGRWDELRYLAGLIAKLGGGPRRQVYAQFAVWLGGRFLGDDIGIYDLDDCVQYAMEWAQRLRNGLRGGDAIPTGDQER